MEEAPAACAHGRSRPPEAARRRPVCWILFKAMLPCLLPNQPLTCPHPPTAAPRCMGTATKWVRPPLCPSWLCPLAHTLHASSEDEVKLHPRLNQSDRVLTAPPALVPTPRVGDTYGSMDYSSADGYGSYGEGLGARGEQLLCPLPSACCCRALCRWHASRFCPHALQLSSSSAPLPSSCPSTPGRANHGFTQALASHAELHIHSTSIVPANLHLADMSTCGTGYSSSGGSSSGYSAPSSPGYGRRLQDGYGSSGSSGYGSSGSSGYGSSGSSGYGSMKKAQVCTVGGWAGMSEARFSTTCSSAVAGAGWGGSQGAYVVAPGGSGRSAASSPPSHLLHTSHPPPSRCMLTPCLTLAHSHLVSPPSSRHELTPRNPPTCRSSSSPPASPPPTATHPPASSSPTARCCGGGSAGSMRNLMLQHDLPRPRLPSLHGRQYMCGCCVTTAAASKLTGNWCTAISPALQESDYGWTDGKVVWERQGRQNRSRRQRLHGACMGLHAQAAQCLQAVPAHGFDNLRCCTRLQTFHCVCPQPKKKASARCTEACMPQQAAIGNQSLCSTYAVQHVSLRLVRPPAPLSLASHRLW